MGWFEELAGITREYTGTSKQARVRGRRDDRKREMGRIAGKDLKQLSDAELDAELVRRRRARGQATPVPVTPAPVRREEPSRRRTGGDERSPGPERAPGWKVRQWYRDLELEPGAPLAEVESAYQRLLDRYDPDKHVGDPDKHRAATRLAAGLGEAYYALKDELSS